MSKAARLLKKAGKYLSILVACLLGLFLVIYFLLQVPSVQNYVAGKITQTLSTQLGTKVTLGHVGIRFFKTVVLKEFYIEDQQQDTLLYAGRLDANISIVSLLKQRIHIDYAGLESAFINLHRPIGDTLFNYEFLFEALSPKDTLATIKDTTASPWSVGLDRVSLKNVRFQQIDDFAGSQLKAAVETLDLWVNELDIEKQKLNVDRLFLAKSRLILESHTPTAQYQQQLASQNPTLPGELPFPYFGWQIRTGQIKLQECAFQFDNNEIERTSNAIDYNHLNVNNLSLELRQGNWNKGLIGGEIRSFQFTESSGFQLDKLTATLRLDSSTLLVDQLVLKTPFTEIRTTTSLDYKRFGALANLPKEVTLQTEFTNSYLGFQDLKLLVPATQQLSVFNADNGQINLSARINGNTDTLVVNELELSLGAYAKLSARGRLSHLLDTSLLAFNLTVDPLSTSYRQLHELFPEMALPPALENFGQFRLQTDIQGTLQKMVINSLNLRTDTYTAFAGSGQVNHPTNPNQLAFDLNIETLRTKASNWTDFLPADSGLQFDSLGIVLYKGQASGTLNAYALNGKLQTAIGTLDTDLELKTNKDFSNGTYSGKLKLQQFRLGTFLGQSSTIGTVSLTAEGEGSGFTLDSLKANVKSKVTSFTYLDYTYRDLDVDGAFYRKQFEGTAALADSNASFNFQGKLNLNDSLPDFDFALVVDTLNFKPLNLISSDLGLRLKMVVNTRGADIDRLDGEMVVSELSLRNGNFQYDLDSLKLVANQTQVDQKDLTLTSKPLLVSLTGDYEISALPNVTLSILNDYFPMTRLVDSLAYAKIPKDKHQDFDLKLELRDAQFLATLLAPTFFDLEGLVANGDFNSREKDINLRAVATALKYDKLSLDSIVLKTNGEPANIQSELRLEQLDFGQARLPQVKLNAVLTNDSIYTQLLARGVEDTTKLNISSITTFQKDWYALSFQPKMVLNDIDWQIDPDNAFLFYGLDWFYLRQLNFSLGGQSLGLQSKGKVDTNKVAPIDLSLKAFQLEEISNLLGLDESFVTGEINGEVTLIDLLSTPHFLADMTVTDLALNEEPVGQLSLQSAQSIQDKRIALTATLKGQNNDFELDGSYYLNTETIDAKLNMARLEMRVIDPFLEGLIHDSDGQVSGQFTIKGDLDQPNIIGKLNLKNVATTVDYLQSRYQLASQSFEVTNQSIEFGKLTLTDEKQRTATLEGKIRHNQLTDFRFNLKFNTDGFQFINTTAKDNDLFYGSLVLKARATIWGTTDLPILDITATTLDGSDFYVAPLTDIYEVGTEDYIIFGKPETLSEDTLSVEKQYKIDNQFAFSMYLNLNLTPASRLNILIDPTTGDQLFARGTGDLSVTIEPNGNISVVGTYLLDSGKYNFNFEQLVKKEFDIQKGSSITFPGDPLKARFNITALYTARTSTYELIEGETTSLSEAEVRTAQGRTEVKVVMNIRGNLDSPEITFDIQLPESQSNVVSSTVARKLNQMKQDPNELNQQVFGLLLFNSFITSSNSSVVLTQAGQNVVISSVSKLLSNQLNRLADKFVKGVDISFDLDSYQNQYIDAGAGGTVTQLQVGLSKTLFNDRLTIKAGGNVNLNAADSGKTDFSTIAGDFVLEYRLTPNGNYRLQVFRRSDYDVLNDANSSKSGIGIFFKKSY
ncbi:MAG: hypothetical protein DHS20C18_46890 [Saprospiraceae bacterium]|nr:MAG: hypothetical protein DHS20C18_46890 [Saprospiraceae bacterium]